MKCPRLIADRLELRLAPAVAHFRAGDGLSSIQDTFISAAIPTEIAPAATVLNVAGAASPGGEKQALIVFRNIFGDAAGQIPNGSLINSATLRLWATDANSPATSITILNAIKPWADASACWAVTGRFQMDGVSAYNDGSWNPAAEESANKVGYQIFGDNLTPTLTRIMNGVATSGWVITSADPTGAWSFASSEDPNPNHRPTLTVDFVPPVGEEVPDYAELAGSPPAPTQLDWFDWADDLREARVARVPSERFATYYFAQNGDDLTGRGTEDQPWKSLAKARSILDSGSADVRLRFRRGDIWRESTVLTTARYENNRLTIDDYGDENLPRPVMTRFQPLSTDWLRYGGILAQPVASSIGWVRTVGKEYGQIFYRAETWKGVAVREFSWCVDSSGSGPFGPGTWLYVNARGFAPVLEACPNDGLGWDFFGNRNLRIENLVLEGMGIQPNAQAYGLKITQNGDDEFVGRNLDVFYTGYHSIGHIGVGGERNVATLIGCSAGLCANRFGNGTAGSGDVTVFVTYAGTGQSEYYQYECTARYGALPSADWRAEPGMSHGAALLSHTNGTPYQMSLLVLWKTDVGFCDNPVAVGNLIGDPATASNIEDARAFIVEDRNRQIPSAWQTAGVVVLNCIYDRTSPPQSSGDRPSAFHFGSGSTGGWMINCTISVDVSQITAWEYVVVTTYRDMSEYIHCHIEVRNAPQRVSLHYSWLPAAIVSAGLRLTNCIISLQSDTGPTILGANNSADGLQHNAYYLSSPPGDPSLGYGNDPGGIELDAPYPAGLAPDEYSALADGGTWTGLEYDQRREPRGNLKTIGPLTGTTTPPPFGLSVLYGAAAAAVEGNVVVSSAAADCVTLAFATAVETGVEALQLVAVDGTILFPRSLSHSADRRSVTWHLDVPLKSGQYTVRFAGTSVGAFRVLPGDFDGDGFVSAADFLTFRLNFLVAGSMADLNCDGLSDVEDLRIFRQHFLSVVP